MKPAKKRRAVPVYTLLVAVFPLMAFYARNIEEVPPADLVMALGRAALISLVVWAILLLLYRHVLKSAIAASAIILALTSYGHLTDLVTPQFGIGVALAEIAFCTFILDIGAFGPGTVNPMAFVSSPWHDQRRANLNGVFDSLNTASDLPLKKFVFAHLPAPHPPFIFAPYGEPEHHKRTYYEQ